MTFNAEEISKHVISQVMGHAEWKMLRALMFAPPGIIQISSQTGQATPYEDSPLKEQIVTVCEAANGKYSAPPNGALAGIVLESAQSLMETLYSNPLDSAYHVPDHFWATDLGQAVMQAQLWARGDELITTTEAARIIRGATQNRDLVYVNSLVEKGALRRYVDPGNRSVTRLSKQQVEEYATR